MAKTSPLHRVIDSGRWDAERLLGRLIIVVHAAFLDAGFVPHPDGAATKAPKPRRVPKQVGATAATLPLLYAVPQLLHQDAGAAALRISLHGRHIVFYACMRSVEPRWPGTYRVCRDALADAPLLSGGLDDTARALRRDPRMAALWGELADGMCRRVLVELCRKNGVELPGHTFMSLPGDAKAAILARLDDGEDLLSASRTCTELRRLVADRDGELWKPRYEALNHRSMVRRGGDDDDLSEMSWKERYVRATWWRSSILSMVRWHIEIWDSFSLLRVPDDLPPPYDPFSVFVAVPAERVADRAAGRRKVTADARSKSAAGQRGAMASGSGREKRRNHGSGAIHSPSSRYRWKHR